MEIISEGTHFRLVQEDELPAILDILQQYLPEAIKFHQTIKTYLNDRVWKFYFYVSKNWPEDPICLHFPGCTLTPKDNIYGSFGIFCPSSRLECIDLLETENILIDWSLEMYLNFTHIGIMNRLDSFYQKYGEMQRLHGDIYVAQKPFKQNELERPLPLSKSTSFFNRLTLVKAIHDLYPASEIECIGLFEKLIGTLPGFGVFVHNTNELCAWMMHSYYGAMFSMQTKPQFRRKGYGIHLAQALTQKVIERGYTPFVVIRPENDASRNLYTKLGYKKAFETVRVTLQPHPRNELNEKLNGHRNEEIIDLQTDEGIEDMRSEIPQPANENSNDVAKDEGIVNEDE